MSGLSTVEWPGQAAASRGNLNEQVLKLFQEKTFLCGRSRLFISTRL